MLAWRTIANSLMGLGYILTNNGDSAIREYQTSWKAQVSAISFSASDSSVVF